MRDTLVMKFSRRLEIFFFLFISGKSCSVLMKCQKIKIHFCSSEKKNTQELSVFNQDSQKNTIHFLYGL